jgi:16S rRNA processing protein RimM
MEPSEGGFDAYDVQIGVVVAPHGLRGELRIGLNTDFPDRFDGLAEVFVRPARGPGRMVPIVGSRYRPDKNQVLLTLEGCASREAAEQLVGATLWVQESQLVPLEGDVYYEFQIIGLTVKTTDGETIGPITEIIHTGTNDVYVTERCLIPAIPDVVRKVDLGNGELTIAVMPGLLD